MAVVCYVSGTQHCAEQVQLISNQHWLHLLPAAPHHLAILSSTTAPPKSRQSLLTRWHTCKRLHPFRSTVLQQPEVWQHMRLAAQS